MSKHQCDLAWLSATIRQLTKVIPLLSIKESDVLEAIRAVNQYQPVQNEFLGCPDVGRCTLKQHIYNVYGRWSNWADHWRC